MTISYADDVVEDRLKALTRKLDSGSGPGQIRLYDGVRPSSGAAITSQNLLVTCFFEKPSAGTVTNGVLVLGVDETPQTCVKTGIAAWARLTNSEGAFAGDCDVAVTGSGSDIEISKVQLYEGGEVTVTLGDLVEV